MSKLASSPVFRRIAISMAIGLVLSFLISEASYWLSPDSIKRAPGRVELVIPAGTASQVAAGQPSPALPANMSFVQGDVLVVRNEDNTSHQLGPIWVPAGSTGSLTLDTAEQYSVDCSFQPSQYLGLNVQPLVTWQTRLWALVVMGVPAGGLLAVYSLAMMPASSKKSSNGSSPA